MVPGADDVLPSNVHSSVAPPLISAHVSLSVRPLTPNRAIALVGCVIDRTSETEMPPYDPLVHYAGSDPKNPKHATLWMSRSLSATPTDADRNTFRAAEELAVMDTGLAGPKWKAVYDYVAGLDAKQPAGAADPYRARHALTAQIQRIFDSYKK